jgi:hypothetical protein
MAQFSVHLLNAIGFTFVGHGGVNAGSVDNIAIERKQVTEVEGSLWRIIDQLLQACFRALLYHCPANDATRASIHNYRQVNDVFFRSTKVNNSSNSALFKS